MSSNPADIELDLPYGRKLLYTTRDSLRVADPSGVLEIEVHFTAEGPIVRVGARALSVRTQESISLHCSSFEVKAREGIDLVTNGDLRQSVAGDASARVGGRMDLDAREARLRARRGDTAIEASDDVRIDGEHILLNS